MISLTPLLESEEGLVEVMVDLKWLELAGNSKIQMFDKKNFLKKAEERTLSIEQTCIFWHFLIFKKIPDSFQKFKKIFFAFGRISRPL